MKINHNLIFEGRTFFHPPSSRLMMNGITKVIRSGKCTAELQTYLCYIQAAIVIRVCAGSNYKKKQKVNHFTILFLTTCERTRRCLSKNHDIILMRSIFTFEGSLHSRERAPTLKEVKVIENKKELTLCRWQ